MQALLDAEQAGQGMLALPAAPHMLEADGSVKVLTLSVVPEPTCFTCCCASCAKHGDWRWLPMPVHAESECELLCSSSLALCKLHRALQWHAACFEAVSWSCLTPWTRPAQAGPLGARSTCLCR